MKSSCECGPSRAEPCWPGPPQLAVPARVGPGQRGFKSSCECEPSQANGHACSLDTKMAWSEHETLYLIELWGEDSIHVQIEGCARNRKVYIKLAEQLKEAGYSRTSVQCREKMKKLKADYKKTKDNSNESGWAHRSTRIFEAMDRILEHSSATCSPVLLETLSVSPAAGAGASDQQVDDVEVSQDFDGEGSSVMSSFSRTSSLSLEESSSSGTAAVCSEGPSADTCQITSASSNRGKE